MTARRFAVTVTKAGKTTYHKTWSPKQWELARSDYFASLHDNRMGYGEHMDRVENLGTKALPYSCETGGTLVRIERVRNV